MKSEIKESSGCRKKVHIEVERERFDSEMNTTLRKLKRDVQIPGFRRGKVPEGILIQRFRGAIQEETLKDLMPKVMEEAFSEQGITPVGDPEILDMQFEETGPITFDVAVEELPVLDIEGFNGLEVTKEIMDVAEEDVDNALERIRRSRAVQEEADREVRDGDIIVVNLQKLDSSGVPIIGERIENHAVVLDGRGTPSPDFDRQVVGMVKGDRRKVQFTYDESINNPDLVGVSESYEVELVQLYENRVPELNDEFVKTLGDYTGLDDLRKKSRETLKKQYDLVSGQKLQWAMIDEFVKQNPFEVPNSMVERVIQSEIDKAREDHPDGKIDENAVRERIRPDAVRSVQTYLIMQKIREEKSLNVSREEISEYLEALAQTHGVNPRELRRVYTKEGRIEDVKNDIIQRKAFEWIESVARITEEPVARTAPQSRIITS